jgi:hypothetical protein
MIRQEQTGEAKDIAPVFSIEDMQESNPNDEPQQIEKEPLDVGQEHNDNEPNPEGSGDVPEMRAEQGKE